MASPPHYQEKLNGQDAAALTAGGTGVFALGLVTPVGAWLVTARGLSCGVTRPLLTMAAFALWGMTWLALRRRWRGRLLQAPHIVLLTGALIVLGLFFGSPILAWFWPGIYLP